MNPQQIQIDELTQRVQFLEEVIFKMSKSDRMVFEKHLQLLDGKNVQLGKTTGTKIGTATDQKVGFLGATPRLRYQFAQPFTAADIGTALESFGFGYH